MCKVINEIQKKYGNESIMTLGDENKVIVDCFSSGIQGLDECLGNGIPKGRIIEIFGGESSGKTTLALYAIASMQQLGGRAAFIDAEHALDPKYAKLIGVKLEKLIFSQPDSGEQALEIVEKLISSNEFGIIVIDSVAALVPQAEINGEMGDIHVGLQARMMSQAMRKITGAASRSLTTVIFINQIREKVGVMFGNPETTPGGRALKFHSSLRIETRRGEKITNSVGIIGNKIKIKVVKNKIAPPFKDVQVPLIYGEGFDIVEDQVSQLIKANKIVKNGSWYSYNDEKIGQGLDKVKKFISENPDL